MPYLFLALVLGALAVWLFFQPLPNLSQATANEKAQPSDSLWRHPRLLLAALGIFLYVGAEVGIGSFIVNFLAQPAMGGFSHADGGQLVSVYWGLAMVGRFVGSYVLGRVAPAKVLVGVALSAAGLAMLAISATGTVAVVALLSIGLCNSIMFPTIFSLGLVGLGSYTEKGSGILCMAIVGGALLPLLGGAVADATGTLANAFWIPVLCYGYIAWFAIRK
jgi:FHS family L-fucose permease-like MFS transporter